MQMDTSLGKACFTITQKAPQAIKLPLAPLYSTKPTAARLGSTNMEAHEIGAPTQPPAFSSPPSPPPTRARCWVLCRPPVGRLFCCSQACGGVIGSQGALVSYGLQFSKDLQLGWDWKVQMSQ